MALYRTSKLSTMMFLEGFIGGTIGGTIIIYTLIWLGF